MAANNSKTQSVGTAQNRTAPPKSRKAAPINVLRRAQAHDPDFFGFTRNVARLLLETGVDLPTLQTHMQRAYVDAASQLSSFRNKRPNQSGIAAMTGLTRAEVKKLLLGSTPTGESERDSQVRGVDRVIHGWLNDREFSKDSKSPHSLARGKGRGTFDTLVLRYGADVPTAAVLRELVRRKRVIVTKNSVSIRSTLTKAPISPATRRFVTVLGPILESLSEKGSDKLELETQSITIELPEYLSHFLLKEHMATAVPVFFEQARIAANGAILSPRRISCTPKGPTVRLQLISLTRK